MFCPKIPLWPTAIWGLIALQIGLFNGSLMAQCDLLDPPISSTAPFWNNFDVDGNTASNEFGILHYYTGSKILAYASLIRVHVAGGALVNVADGLAFDGTEDFSGTGEYSDLAVGDWQIIFKYVPDGRLGFLNFTVTDDGNSASPDSISVTRFGLQDTADTDGIIAGDCGSLNNTTLPIELAFFEAQALGTQVILNWSTASETENLGFDIQRSLDAVNFESVGWQEGQGDSQHEVKYQFVDETAIAGLTYYYRLVNRDRNGGGATSSLRSASLAGQKALSISEVYPNPVFGDQAQLQVVSERRGEMQWSLYDGRGQVVEQQVMDLEKGVQLLNLELSARPSGHYYLLVQQDTELWKKRIIISR